MKSVPSISNPSAESHNGISVNASDSLDPANRHPFGQHGDRVNLFVEWKDVWHGAD